MTVEKVKVTKEVAEALYEVERNYIGINIAITFHAKNALIGKYAPLQSLSIEDLARALINGYEVEKSPEENVRAYYEQTRKISTSPEEAAIVKIRADGTMRGIRNTLDLLGISIEGVNA